MTRRSVAERGGGCAVEQSGDDCGIIEAMKYQIVITQDESGYYVAECPVLPGCFSQGKTREEALANIAETIDLAIETRRSLGRPVPAEFGVNPLSWTLLAANYCSAPGAFQ